MPSFRGDAHRVYLQIRKSPEKIKSIRYIKETEEIQKFYKTLDSHTLQLVYYRMIKEKNGSGIVPIFATAIPWLLFLFSKQLQEILFQQGSINWLIFGVIYLVILTLSLVVHFREKAWANFHIEIIQDIQKDRDKDKNEE